MDSYLRARVSIPFIIGRRLLGLCLGCLLTLASLASERVKVLETGSQAGHYLSWKGHPILLVGDSVTQGWMECGTNFDQRSYVDALAGRGVNLLMLWAFKGTDARRQQQDKRLGYDAPELWPWAGSPEARSFDLRRFNPAYFSRLKELVNYAESKGIVVLITVHDGWTKTCFDGHPFNQALGNGPLAAREQYVALADGRREMPAEFDAAWDWRQQNQYFQERFCAELIATLQPFSNVIYEMFNEGEWYDKARRREHEQHFLAFFRARCQNLLLSNSDAIAGDRPHQDAKVDVVTLHPQGWVGQAGLFASGFRKAPPRPYLYSEPVPEFDGEKPSLDEIRRSMWEVTMAGAGWVNQNDPSFGWDKHAAIAAKAAPRDLAYDFAGHCARFFNEGSVRFWEMSPQSGLAGTGACLAQPGVEYLVYLASGGITTVDLSAARGRELRVRWFNPRTGEFQSAEAVQGGSSKQEFKPPFAGDAVLHLRSNSE
jgi:hypothetical protein